MDYITAETLRGKCSNYKCSIVPERTSDRPLVQNSFHVETVAYDFGFNTRPAIPYFGQELKFFRRRDDNYDGRILK
jgi:hypothetical protein